VLRRIILPQALVIAFPVVGNQVLEVFKATTLFSIIGAAEIVTEGRHLLQRTFYPAGVWLMVGLFYFVVSYPATILLRYAEQRLVVRGD
jgi:ABC-type amino acid transport system permease subunit